MNCPEVQDRLSAYFDGETSDDEQSAIALHLEGCPACRHELAAFGKLANLSSSLRHPQAPSALWNRIETHLDSAARRRAKSTVIMPPSRPRGFPVRPIALAASLLVAVGMSVAGFKIWFKAQEPGHLVIDFQHYLEEFDQNPDKAQQILLAKYNGQPTTVQQAALRLDYEPAIAKGLPPGCSLKDVYLLEMPCCTCAHAVYEREDGQQIAVFEHNVDQPVRFGGNRPAIDCTCNNKPTRIVQIDERLAATWRHRNRYITIIGARDLEEVEQFIAHLSQADSGA